ncbi:MAG: hypothetical protein U9O82_00070 [Thermodesulfobacteriota bacterium]|nr:hypothetical protein [Thermodesulfobacteriota bacterium]
MRKLQDLHSIRRLVFSSACGAVYDQEETVSVEGCLHGGKFTWRRAAHDCEPDTVALDMGNFVFRLVDIPPGNQKVLAGQINSFLPFASQDIVWQVIPVADQSFLVAMNGEKWRQIQEKLKGKRGRIPFVIPSLVAALLYHIWHHTGDSVFAVPAGDRFLLAHMSDGYLQKIDYCDTIGHQDVVLYDRQEMLAGGAALYNLIPHGFEGDLNQRKPFPRLFRRTILSTALACSLGLFFIFSVFQRDMSELNLISDAITKIKKESRNIERIISRNQKIADTASFVEKVNREYISPYLVLGDIAAHLGENTRLIDFFLDAGKGRMSGISRDVTGMLETISNRPYVTKVEFTTPIVRDNVGNERFQINFQINRKTMPEQQGTLRK